MCHGPLNSAIEIATFFAQIVSYTAQSERENCKNGIYKMIAGCKQLAHEVRLLQSEKEWRPIATDQTAGVDNHVGGRDSSFSFIQIWRP